MTPNTRQLGPHCLIPVNCRNTGCFRRPLGFCHNRNFLHETLAQASLRQVNRWLVWNRWITAADWRILSDSLHRLYPYVGSRTLDCNRLLPAKDWRINRLSTDATAPSLKQLIPPFPFLFVLYLTCITAFSTY